MSASWILTQSRKQFDLLAPEPDMVVLDDIAHALANICRFAGYTQTHYSVGQHSVLASHLVPPADALHALLHDAAEAYVGDMVSPLKDLLPGFKVIEARIWMAIAARFEIAAQMPAGIKEADLVPMATERRDLLPPGPPWPSLKGIQPLPNEIVPWAPAFTRLAFKRRFKQLVRSGARDRSVALGGRGLAPERVGTLSGIPPCKNLTKA